MGEYIAQSYIGGDKWVVNFADASAKGGGDPLLIYRYGQDVNSSEMMQFARYMENIGDKTANFKPSRDIFRAFEDLRCYPELENVTAALPQNNFKWYPETQFIYLKKGSFFFAAKGGFNNESHNHNDVGSFILYRTNNHCSLMPVWAPIQRKHLAMTDTVSGQCRVLTIMFR